MKAILPQGAAHILEAAAAGAFLSILMQPKLGWKQALTIFSAGLLTAYFFAAPLSYKFSIWTGADIVSSLPLSGFTLGFLGMYLCSAALALASDFGRNPLGILSQIRRIWRGENADDASR